ncbi:MAG: hypothetical protein DWQ35_19885 [Planctomycetota bacterium]|nr:MAG: hypothetical protein DWQ35_19885 [Planctomycetota bacterium]REK28416.1 MAG: hypothetical protein DWQ42_05415 [Planctomycetota bacterium]REK48432.1 MAG: hypothetical protein DWQ46_02565 [Planctomycetota bacterium]
MSTACGVTVQYVPTPVVRHRNWSSPPLPLGIDPGTATIRKRPLEHGAEPRSAQPSLHEQHFDAFCYLTRHRAHGNDQRNRRGQAKTRNHHRYAQLADLLQFALVQLVEDILARDVFVSGLQPSFRFVQNRRDIGDAKEGTGRIEYAADHTGDRADCRDNRLTDGRTGRFVATACPACPLVAGSSAAAGLVQLPGTGLRTLFGCLLCRLARGPLASLTEYVAFERLGNIVRTLSSGAKDVSNSGRYSILGLPEQNRQADHNGRNLVF